MNRRTFVKVLGAITLTGILKPAKVVRFEVTAYCPCKICCGKWSDGITASGTKADHPLVAAPPEYEFGTQMKIPGYSNGKWVKVEDRGDAIKENRLDVLFPSHQEALQWRKQEIGVEIRSIK